MSTPDSWLSSFLTRHGGAAGSVHVREGDVLVFADAVRLPPPVIEATRIIPRGKGMAGLAWERNTPIQTCNLQEDRTGAVKPGARAVNAQAAVALPVHGPDGEVRAVVGIAWMDERVLADDVLAALSADAATLPTSVPPTTPS